MGQDISKKMQDPKKIPQTKAWYIFTRNIMKFRVPVPNLHQTHLNMFELFRGVNMRGYSHDPLILCFTKPSSDTQGLDSWSGLQVHMLHPSNHPISKKNSVFHTKNLNLH